MSLKRLINSSEFNCFFVTTTCLRHLPLLTFGNSSQIVSDSINYTAKKYQVKILGYVLMPNHIHFILWFENKSKLSDFMRDWKKFTSVFIRKEIEKSAPSFIEKELRYTDRKQKLKVWEDGFDDLVLTSRKYMSEKLDYIHNNPMQLHWNLAKFPEEYPYSSACFYMFGKQSDIFVTHYMDCF